MSIVSPSRYDKEFSTGLFDCADVCCSPLWWNAILCQGVVWGQILTRLKLSYWGARDGSAYKNTFFVFLGLWIIYVITDSIWTSVDSCVQDAKKKPNPYYNQPSRDDDCAAGLGLVAYLAALVLFVMMCVGKMKARNYLRRRAGIKSTCYIGNDTSYVDDCLCVTFCDPCTSIQMMLETQQNHRYNCCHKAGYPPGIEVNLFGDEDDEGEDVVVDSFQDEPLNDVENQHKQNATTPSKMALSIGKQSTPSQQYGQIPVNDEESDHHLAHHSQHHHQMEAEMTDMQAGVMVSSPEDSDNFRIE